MTSSTKWLPIWRWHTGYNADSVEWCPLEPYRHVFVCGTYQLDQNESNLKPNQQRLGRIYLFTISEATTELKPIQTINTAGILDQKWCYHFIGGAPILAVVSSEGNLQLYRLAEKETLNLEPWLEVPICHNRLALSLDWSTNKLQTAPKIVVSDSSGSVAMLRVEENALVKDFSIEKSHKFEAWIAAFNYWNPDVFYSGGDDCVFKSYDTRVPGLVVASNRNHEAGVTAVRSHVDVEYQLLTGSYDDKIRLWDARSLKRCVTEKNLNGGVWRLKWHPFQCNTILAACMYGGFRIVKLEEEFNVACEYMEHESIAYGADWKFDEQRHLVATCSFYDCKLHISEVVL